MDQAADFVMSKINRRVGTRAQGPEAPVTYELPGEAVGEAIVNAVAHRDYASNASVQVMLFSDRLEVWNPGELPPPLTVEKLRLPHASLPRNPLLADPLFLTRYIEKAGSGILDMIRLCRQAGLPEPEYRQDGGMFVQTLSRDWLTEALMEEMGLNERQRSGVVFARQQGRITSREYQQLTGASARTASRDLDGLISKGIFSKVGRRGPTTHYVFARPAEPQTRRRTRSEQPALRKRPSVRIRTQFGHRMWREIRDVVISD